MTNSDAESLAHFKNLVAARTNSAGAAIKGYKANVAMLKREIAAIEERMAKRDALRAARIDQAVEVDKARLDNEGGASHSPPENV